MGGVLILREASEISQLHATYSFPKHMTNNNTHLYV